MIDPSRDSLNREIETLKFNNQYLERRISAMQECSMICTGIMWVTKALVILLAIIGVAALCGSLKIT